MSKIEYYSFEEEIMLAVNGWIRLLRDPSELLNSVVINEEGSPTLYLKDPVLPGQVSGDSIIEFANNLYAFLNKRTEDKEKRVSEISAELSFERYSQIHPVWCSLVCKNEPEGELAQAAAGLPDGKFKFPSYTMINIWPRRVLLVKDFNSSGMKIYRLEEGK